jgi:hypothetical protein
MSPRPRRLRRPHHSKHKKRVVPQVVPRGFTRDQHLFADAWVKGVVVAFGVGAFAAVAQGEGERPPEQYGSPYAAGNYANVLSVASTSSLTSSFNFSSLLSPSSNVFRLK